MSLVKKEFLLIEAFTWAASPEKLIIIEDGCYEEIDDGHPELTLCEDGEYRVFPQR